MYAELTKEKNDCVKEFVRLAIFSENSRDFLTRDNIVKYALNGYHGLFKQVFNEAQEILRKVFALEMVETSTRVTTKGGIDGTTGNKKFILR
jgi:melanoma-associated antigen